MSTSERKGWYPGKYMMKSRAKRTEKEAESHRTDLEKEKEKEKEATTGSITDKKNTTGVRKSDNIIRKSPYHHCDSPVIGQVHIKISSAKFLLPGNHQPVKICVEYDHFISRLDMPVKHASKPEDTIELFYNESFNLRDVDSDVSIKVFRNSATNISSTDAHDGITILPVTSYLNMMGQPLPPTPSWMKLFPAYEKNIHVNCTPGLSNKFVSGFFDLQGYGMNRNKDPLGFLQVSVEIQLHPPVCASPILPPVAWLYFMGERKVTPLLQVDTLINNYSSPEQSKSTEKSSRRPSRSAISRSTHTNSSSSFYTYTVLNQGPETFVMSVLNRDLDRLWRATCVPTCVSHFTTFPEVFLLLGLVGFLSYSIEKWQLPLLLYFVTMFNGHCTASARVPLAHALLFNEYGYDPLTDTDRAISASVKESDAYTGGAMEHIREVESEDSHERGSSDIGGIGDEEGAAENRGLSITLSHPPSPSPSPSPSVSPSPSPSPSPSSAYRPIPPSTTTTTTTTTTTSLSHVTKPAKRVDSTDSTEDTHKDTSTKHRETHVREVSVDTDRVHKLQPTVQHVNTISQLVRRIEIFNGLLSFADKRISLLFYTFTGVLSITVSLILYLRVLSDRSFLFLSAIIALILSLGLSLLDQLLPMVINFGTPTSTAASITSTSSNTASILPPIPVFLAQLSAAYQSVLILLDKVPDEPELLHRHVCALMSTVEEKGGEWVDAGEAFKKLTAAKK